MSLKRWIIANKLYAGLFILIAIFAYIDIFQIKTFFILDSQHAWDLYNTYTGPSLWTLWAIIILIIGIIYYLFSKDKSEAIGITAAGLILLATGTEDVFYFALSGQEMPACMQWFNDLNAPVGYWSANILKEKCTSPFALTSFAFIGIVGSYFIFKKLKQAKW